MRLAIYDVIVVVVVVDDADYVVPDTSERLYWFKIK